MSHGDQAKAKTAKSSQASASQKSSSKTAVEAGKSGKAGGKEAGQAPKIVVKTQAGPQKGGSPAAPPPKAGASVAKESGNGGKTKGRPAPVAAIADDDAPFSNPTVANAFKRAVKKYPNAFRKLTD